MRGVLVASAVVGLLVAAVVAYGFLFMWLVWLLGSPWGPIVAAGVAAHVLFVAIAVMENRS